MADGGSKKRPLPPGGSSSPAGPPGPAGPGSRAPHGHPLGPPSGGLLGSRNRASSSPVFPFPSGQGSRPPSVASSPPIQPLLSGGGRGGGPAVPQLPSAGARRPPPGFRSPPGVSLVERPGQARFQISAPSGPTWADQFRRDWPSSDSAELRSSQAYRPPSGRDDLSSQPSSQASGWAKQEKKDRVEAAKDSWDLDRTSTELRDKIRGLPTSETKGWCRLTSLAPTKEGGYIQISVTGMNKVMTLQEGLLIVQGDFGLLDRNRKDWVDHISHRCDQPACCTVGHVCVEDIHVNNSRKGCGKFMACPCGHGLLLLCEHRPVCIPNWKPSQAPSFEQFLANANICHHRETVGGVPYTRQGRPQNLR